MGARHLDQQDLARQKTFTIGNRELLGEGKKYHIITFGCQLNNNDSEKISGILKSSGMEYASSPDEADLVLLNTCSVRENADDRFFGNLGRMRNLQKDKPGMIIGVCGCMMHQDHHVDKLRQSYPYVDLVFGTSDIWRLPELLNRRLRGSRRVYDISSEDIIDESLPIQRERKYRALVTIMYGCNNFCSYCIVPYARGRERSRLAKDILAELKQLGDDGFGEVMLLGQNVNTYGKDLIKDGREDSLSFAELLEQAAQTSGLPRIRFMTSHPKDISIELLDVISRNPNIERHLHLPVQSGSDRVIKLMNRKYTVEQYLRTVEEARARIPGIQFSTDLIVGFPGETEEDFQLTLDLVEKVRFQSAFTFQYSPREGTPAAKKEEIAPDIMKDRFQRLVDLQNRISLEIAEEQTGREFSILVEGASDHQADRFTGRSTENFLVNFDTPEEILNAAGLDGLDSAALGARLEGAYINVRVNEARTFSLNATALEIQSLPDAADQH